MSRGTGLTRRRALVLGAATLAVGGGGFAFSRFRSDMEAAHRRIRGRSRLARTSFGLLEYAVAGRGPPMLMIHGTGGGFDQGLLFSESIRRLGVSVIAPSRFGYLRSEFPADPSSENQADALVQLLDRLGIERLPVAGGSAGALSAAQFALRHPDRCAALILLVPAANVRDRDPVAMSAFQRFLVERLVRSDFAYWTALKTAPEQLIGTLLATDPRLVERAPTAEQRRVRRILEQMLPISARSRGMLNDGRLAGAPARMDFAAVRAPTLVLSAEDDRFGTAATARDLAASVPNCRLVLYPSGGHVWIGHDEDVAREVVGFIRALAPNG